MFSVQDSLHSSTFYFCSVNYLCGVNYIFSVPGDDIDVVGIFASSPQTPPPELLVHKEYITPTRSTASEGRRIIML